MSRPVLVEACVTTLGEAVEAEIAGADRLELCRELHTGGLTPSLKLFSKVKARVGIPVFAMVRTGTDSFTATPAQTTAMAREIRELSAAGADGIVLGILDHSKNIDSKALAKLVTAAAGLPVTFHRAFDLTPDPMSSMTELARTGVSRILTAGGAGTAWEGRKTIRTLVGASGGVPVILAGGGIRSDHADLLARETGVAEIHARALAIPGIIEALRRESGA